MAVAQHAARDGNGAGVQGESSGSVPGTHRAGVEARSIPRRADAASPGAEAPGRHEADSWLRSRHDGEIFRLAIPALAAVMLDPLMGLVDTAIVGRLGAAQLGAVGLATVRCTALAHKFLVTIRCPCAPAQA